MERQTQVNQRIRSCLSAMERSIDSARSLRINGPKAPGTPGIPGTSGVATTSASTTPTTNQYVAPTSEATQSTLIGARTVLPQSDSPAQDGPNGVLPAGPVRLKAKAKRSEPNSPFEHHLPRQAG